VTADDSPWAALFPDLFATRHKGYADCRLSFTTRAVPDALVAHVADSLSGAPYRPHLPHPRAYWAYAATDAELAEQA
jgi:hypothetical protein